MPVNAVGSASAGNATAANTLDQQKSFRETDFMKIILAEITQQDPFKPQETGKIVDDMQKLQELANSKYEKFRDDQRWARDLIGQPVTVQQMAITKAEADKLRDQGIAADVGYGSKIGEVETYRVVGETVYVSVDGKDYPIDNVKQVQPKQRDGAYLAELSEGMLGRRIQYWGETPTDLAEGVVTAVSLNNGDISLTVGGKQVPLDHVKRIGLAG